MADYRAMARRAAQRHGIDPDTFEAQIRQESGFNPSARSPAGAMGIAQIMPGTARGWGVNPMDPAAALDAAARAMSKYVRQFGNYADALRAYNAGPGNVKASRGFGETNNYVRSILGGRHPSAAGARSSSTTRVTTSTPGVDNRQARTQLLQSFLGQHGHRDLVGFALQMRGLRDVAPTSSTRTMRSSGGGGGGARVSGGGGTASFDGKPVAAWMVPALRYARQHGWSGSISSGVRTRAEQARLYANRGSNPYPVARPGSSNHEIENGGAVDVTDPAALARAMRGYRGKRLRQGTAIGDPIHFSATGR